MSQYWEELVNEIYSLDSIDEKDIQEVLSDDWTPEELTQLHVNLTKIKRKVLAAKRKLKQHK